MFVPLQSLPPVLQGLARAVPLTYAVSLLGGFWKGERWSPPWRRRGAGGRIRSLHGTLSEGVSLGKYIVNVREPKMKNRFSRRTL